MYKEFSSMKESLEFINCELDRMHLDAQERLHAGLMCEESLNRLMIYADFSVNKDIGINVRKFLGNVLVDIAVPGERFNFAESIGETLNLNNHIPPDSIETAQNILLRLFSSDIKYKYAKSRNILKLRAVRSSYSFLLKTLCALFLAIITGLLMRSFVPEDMLIKFNENVFDMVRDIFLDGMKMCTIPVVLFSVALCSSDVGSLSNLKRTGGKLLVNFLIIQAIAVVIGFDLVKLFGTGTGARLDTIPENIAEAEIFSITEMLRKVIPENIFSPVIDGHTIQLTVLGFLVGLGAGLTDAKLTREGLNELNNIFMKITELFMRFVPLVVFCSVASMVITQGLDTIFAVLGILCTSMIGFVLMMIVYCVMLKVLTGLSPITMFRKSIKVIITAFSTCSTSAALPDSLKACESMGISPKLYSFSMPIGASLNKNAFCLDLAVIVLSVANMYGCEMTWFELMTVGITIIIIAPGTSWAPVIALSTLFSQISCPVEASVIVLGIYTLLDMGDTVTCCMGTIASTLVIAKKEGLIDTQLYQS